MSINISLSHKKNNSCDNIINALLDCGIDGRVIYKYSINC